MRYSCVFLPLAKREVRTIALYLEGCRKGLAAAFIDGLEGKIGLVREHPEMCSLVADVRLAARGYRSFLIGRYVVLYRVEGELVVIVHVFHQSQDYVRVLRSE